MYTKINESEHNEEGYIIKYELWFHRGCDSYKLVKIDYDGNRTEFEGNDDAIDILFKFLKK